MFVDEGKMVIPWNNLMLRLTKDDAHAMYKGLERLLSNKSLRRSSSQKHTVHWGKASHKFTFEEASSLSETLIDHIRLSEGELTIKHDVGDYLSKEDLGLMCIPMRISNLLLARVWTVLTSEAQLIPDFGIWCNLCMTTKDHCTHDDDHPRESNSRVFELEVAALIKHSDRFQHSIHRYASIKVRSIIHTVISSLENTRA